MFSARALLTVLCLLTSATADAADGGVHLYLQPFPPEAVRLSLTLQSVTAIGADGAEYPLLLHLPAPGPASAVRQRFLASGTLPSGRYAGFAIRVTRASMQSDRGSVALAVPEAPARIDAPFVVSAGRIPLLWLTLQYRDPLAAGAEFVPAFTAVVPPKPIADHTGLVTNLTANTITVFDKSLPQAVAVIATCNGPAGVALDQLRRRAYVACATDDEVHAIDVASLEIVQRTRLSPGDQPRELALTPDGATLVVASPGSNSVSVLDASSLTRQERINVGNGPGPVLIDPAGRRAFVFNTLSSSVSVIDIASRSVAATLSLDAPPVRAQFGGNGTRLYVIHERSPYLTALDPRQLTVVTRARLSTAAGALAVDAVRGLICVASATDATIEFYDPNALMPLYAMRTGALVSHATVDRVDNRLLMVSREARRLIIASLADRKVVSEIDVGDGAYWVAVMGEK